MINWYAQEHPSSCVAACVRMVLTTFEQHHQEKDIRQLLGNPRFGLTMKQAANKLNGAGTVTHWQEQWGIDDLRDCLRESNYPIVGVERRFFGHPSAAHAVVLTSIKSDVVEMLDPLAGPEIQITQVETFTSAWHSAGQEALVIISPLII